MKSSDSRKRSRSRTKSRSASRGRKLVSDRSSRRTSVKERLGVRGSQDAPGGGRGDSVRSTSRDTRKIAEKKRPRCVASAEFDWSRVESLSP